MKVKILLLIGTTCSLFFCCTAAPVVFDPGGFSMTLVPTAERELKLDGVEVETWPDGIMDADHTDYLTSGSLTSIIMSISNPDSLPLSIGRLEFDLPATVSFEFPDSYLNWGTKTEQTLTRDGIAYNRYSLNCYVGPTTIPPGRTGAGYFSRARPACIWVKINAPEGTNLGKLYMHFKYEVKGSTDFVEGKETWVNLKASAPLSSEQPKLVESGVMGRFNLNRSNTAPGSTELALGNYIRELGYNYVTTHLPIPAETGVKQWVESPIQNLLEFHQVPPALQFVLKGKALDNVITPSAIYHQDPWVKANVFAAIDKAVSSNNVAAIWMNYEPYAYVEQGDQSVRNRDEFIAWSKLSADDVTAVWPDSVAKKYPDQWHQFLSWQAEQCTKTFIQVIADAGKPYGTTPRFALATTNDWIWSKDMNPDSPVSILGWGDIPITLQTWNFMYVPAYNSKRFSIDRPMAPQAARSYALATDLTKTLEPNPQMKIGCLYGWDQTGGAGFFFPEQLAFYHTITALAGADNVQNYAAWPVWDGRYATAIADANKRIAHWEPFTVEGKKLREHVVIPVTDYPQKVPDNITPAEQQKPFDWAGKTDPNYLYSFEYEKEGRRLIVVANTWTGGDVFYKLRVFNLDPTKKYVVWETEQNRFFVPSAQSKAWTSSQLQTAGPIIQTGSDRISCFIIEEYDSKKDYGIAVTTDDVAQAIKIRQTLPDPFME